MGCQCSVNDMKAKLRILMRKESFFPSWIGIFVNTFYFARRGLADAMMRYSKSLSGVLLDVGCGTKPYQSLFDVDEYVGFDIDSENTRKRGIADYFYDGSLFPFPDEKFNAILCNQVLEHVFNPDQFLGADISTLFQLTNAYLYKISERWNKYVK